jgi:hypothetical protein
VERFAAQHHGAVNTERFAAQHHGAVNAPEPHTDRRADAEPSGASPGPGPDPVRIGGASRASRAALRGLIRSVTETHPAGFHGRAVARIGP